MENSIHLEPRNDEAGRYGVTLYHVATGQLPFRPYGGRRNKETMYSITTEKSPGVISGVQTSESGPIEWSRELPESCQLTLGLRRLVTPLLAGLLEADPQRMWSFERFFTEVTTSLGYRAFHIFFVNRVQPLTVYMDPNHKFEELQILICEQTELEPLNQLLLLDNKLLSEIVESEQPVRTYPITSSKTPLVLFSRNDDDVVLMLPEMPAVKFGSFPTTVNVEHDAAVGKSLCSTGHVIKRKVDYFTRLIQLTEYSILNFIEMFTNSLKTLNSQLSHSQALTVALSDRFSQLVTNHRRFLTLTQLCAEEDTEGITQPLRERLEDLVGGKVEGEKGLRDSLNAVTPVVRQLNERVVGGGLLRRQWRDTTGNNGAAVERAPNKGVALVAKMKESWQHLLRDRASRTLTLNDEQFHLLEKMKMKETTRTLESLMSSVSSVLNHHCESLADWCKIAIVHRVQAEIAESDLRRHESLLEGITESLTETEEKYHLTLSQLLAVIKDTKLQRTTKSSTQELIGSKNPQATTTTTETVPQAPMKQDLTGVHLKHRLRDLRRAEDEVLKLLEENGNIIKQFQRLAVNLTPIV